MVTIRIIDQPLCESKRFYKITHTHTHTIIVLNTESHIAKLTANPLQAYTASLYDARVESSASCILGNIIVSTELQPHPHKYFTFT